MGFEAFRVELRGGKTSYQDVDAAIRKLPHIRPDRESVPIEGSTFYVMDDGRHVIEMELMDSPIRVSCRFTLCHPPSIDGAFLALVHDLMHRFGMEARICDDVRPEDSGPFSVEKFAEFSATVQRYIGSRRQEWVAAFGVQPLAATTNEVYQRIILPRCEQGVTQPT